MWRALVLCGGESSGEFQAGAISILARRSDQFDFFAGAGAGALDATVLAQHARLADGARALLELRDAIAAGLDGAMACPIVWERLASRRNWAISVTSLDDGLAYPLSNDPALLERLGGRASLPFSFDPEDPCYFGRHAGDLLRAATSSRSAVAVLGHRLFGGDLRVCAPLALAVEAYALALLERPGLPAEIVVVADILGCPPRAPSLGLDGEDILAWSTSLLTSELARRDLDDARRRLADLHAAATITVVHRELASEAGAEIQEARALRAHGASMVSLLLGAALPTIKPSAEEHRRALEALLRNPTDAALAQWVAELTQQDPEGARAARIAIAPESSLDTQEPSPRRETEPLLEPRNLPELLLLMERGAAQKKPLKAVGAGYAFSNILETSGLSLGMSRYLNRILPIDPSSLVAPAASSSLVTFEAGATVGQLNEYLWRRGQALPNQPGYERLSYAGSMSAGAHGSGIRIGPLSAPVRALHLLTVDGGGRVVQKRIEPTAGITNRARFEAARGVELVQNDGVFHACTVGVGCLGVIYSVTVKVEERYFLRERRSVSSWADVRGALAGYLRDPGIHSVHVWLNPYPVDGKVRCVLTLYEPAEGPRRGHRAFGITWGGVAALAPTILWIMALAPAAIPGLLNASLRATVPPGEPPVLPCTEALNFGPANQIAVEAGACGVDVARTVEATDALLDLFQRRARQQNAYVTSPLGLRFVKAASAPLSPQYGRDTCMIELPQLKGTHAALETIDAFHDLLFKRFQGRPHWGLVNRQIDRTRMVALYPALPTFLAAYLALNPLGTFDDAFSRQVGLRALVERARRAARGQAGPGQQSARSRRDRRR